MKGSKRSFAIQAALAAVLLFLTAVIASRVVSQRVRHDVRLDPATKKSLAGLHGQVLLTYFESGRSAMPSSMQETGEEVEALLAAMKAAAPDHVDVRVLDPDADPLGAAYASRHGASPVRVRRVVGDESSEAAVWSSLCIAWERHPDGLIQGIMPGDIPHLEALIVETLANAENPRHPTIAIAAPAHGYEQLRAQAGGLVEGRVVPAGTEPGLSIPPEADLLLWIQPRSPTPADAATLERFLSSGRSVILAGSSCLLEPVPGEGAAHRWHPGRASHEWHDLLRSFGVEQDTMVLLDERHAPITWHVGQAALEADAPFQLRILPSCLDTRTLLGPNSGVLVVSSVSALRWDPAALAATERRPIVLATSSESSSATEVPEADFDESSLEAGRPIAKQPWLVRFAASDRWKGDLIVAGSPVLFHDDTNAKGTSPNANQPFTRTLLRTFTSPERLARIRVPRNEPARVEPLSLGARLAWRSVTVFLVPVILLGLAVLGRRSRPAARTSTPALRLAAGIGAFALLASLAAFVETAAPARADLTEGTVNTSSESTMRRLETIRGDLHAELVASEAFRMPPALKRVESRVLASLRDLGIPASLVRPEDLGDAARRNLTDAGIEPFDVRGVANDATAQARVWSALRLSHAGRTEIIPRLDARTVENLDFLLCAAFERLSSGHKPLVAVLSDLPRLSPAEAHDYQTKGYAAPIGSDVYSDVKETLSEYGYRVTYVNPETEALPDAMDVLLWLQPRYPQKAYPKFTEYLASGGRAIVALQHYNVQQRQWRGTGFKTVYWPQPQFHRFNEYLELIGVRQLGEKRAEKSGELPGEVLFDRQHSDLVLKTEVHRSAFGDPEEQQVSRPFLIRAAGAGLAADSPITARLSGLEFIWGSRFTIDQGKLAREGLTSQTLATTSPRAWTYAWSGGNIPDESFTEPKDLLPGPQPLAILLEGRFPRVAFIKDENSRETMAVAGPDSAPASASSRPFVPAPGKLLLVGCSEMFKNEHLRAAGYQHDQFLLNATAFLAYGPELAAVQARTYAPRVLAYQPEGVITRWRAITLALPPVLFLLIGLARRLWGGRAARKLTLAPESPR